MSAQSWLNRVWYIDARPPPWLLPFETLFRGASTLRRWLYSRNICTATRLACPVIVVGNLSVGGTGKTPLVCWLIDELRLRGHKPGVVTRGYGGSSRSPRLLQGSGDAAVDGDEPVLLARRTLAPVVVGRDRPAAAQILVNAGCDVIVSDDGLQHYALARDCEIVVVDAERGFGNGHLLPAGPLREGRSRLAEVDAIVLNGAKERAGPARSALRPASGGAAPGRPARGKPVFGMQLQAQPAVSLRGAASRTLGDFAGCAVHAVAGIGNPQRFFNMLRSVGIEVTAHELPDHAVLQPQDIEFGDGLPVLMTEKDAVKCDAFANSQHWYVPVNAVFETDEGSELLGIVIRLIGEHGKSTRGNHG